MHAPEGSWVAGGDLVLESGFVGEDFGAVEAADCEGLGEGGFGDQLVVDFPGFEESGCVRCEL